MLHIYNKISDYIIVVNYIGEIIFCNESFLRRLDYKLDEILNLNISEITINNTLHFYTKSKEIIQINSSINIENINNQKSIFIIGKEIKSKSYTMAMLESLLDNINICTFILNKDGKYLYVNEPFAKILNKEREDIIGTYSHEYWEPNIYNEFYRNNKEVFKNRSPKIFNEKVNYSGNVYWYESYRAPIFDESNNPKYIVATTKNINLSKTISEELYKNYNLTTDNINKIDLEEILRNIGENVLDYTGANGMSVFLYNRDEERLRPTIKLKDSNKYFKDIEFIQLKDEDIGSCKYENYMDYIHPKENICQILPFKYNCLDEVSYIGSYKIALYNEFIGVIEVNYSNDNYPKFNSDEYMKYICNKIAMIIKNIRLVEEVYIENKKRKFTEKELEQYLDVSADLVSKVGKDGYFKRLSPNWYNVLGWNEEELLSMPCEEIVHPEELKSFEGRQKYEEIEGKNTRHIIRFRHKKGHYICLEWNSKYLGEEEVYITSARDITKDLQIEKEKRKLEEAVKSEIVKNEFFSNISHEFRTPINIILGTMQVINKKIEKNNIDIHSLKKYANYIRQNSYRLLKLVNNLIDISKMDIGAYELTCNNQNIISIIEDITLSVADYMKSKKINLVFDTDEEEIITYCDPDKIERIMLNLLSNAIKYTPENGFIEVEIKSSEDEIIVYVKDSGVGIPQDKLDIIFDRFGQVDDSLNRKCEGSGIGLSLVKNLVEMHGGKISVNSKVGQGSEFRFSIPIKIKDENNINEYDGDRRHNHVERCDIEFSDIYSM